MDIFYLEKNCLYFIPFYILFSLFFTFLYRPEGVWADPIPSRAAVARPPSVKLADSVPDEKQIPPR